MSKEGGKILVLDDDESILLLAKYVLSQQFTDVITLSDPGKIEEVLHSNKIGVALLDMNFTIGATTGQEGFDLLKLLCQQSPSTRVIMMTAYGDLDIAIKAIKEGADDFIVKPWDNVKFLSIVMTSFRKGPAIRIPIRNPHHGLHSHASESKDILEVERVFMFLDMVSATTIAENLGHLRYFELLNEFFEDIAEPIRKYKGEIYQYVGDEVVVSWSLTDGLENANCIRCFFSIEDTMQRLAGKYMNKYQMVPKFKAGMHCGKVTTGVVGTYKKEIVYTGDVLNTTSRIEGQCNANKVNLLFSRELKDKIQLDSMCKLTEIGEINLKGKASTIAIFTCNRN